MTTTTKADSRSLMEDPALADDRTPGGFGAIETPKGVLPLKELAVSADVAGLSARVDVRQTFRNSFNEPLEATYVFPLPERAAVTSFRLTVAGRVIEGDLKERNEARREYDAAIKSGHRAAIAEEDRSGVFSLCVGNLPPGEDAVVELSFVGPLDFTDGEATFRFPLVVAPRYIPGVALDGPSVGLGTASDTNLTPDASRISPPVLLKGYPNPVALSLEVRFDPSGLKTPPGGWAASFRSSLHSVVITEGEKLAVRLQPGERLNRDFILRFPVGGLELQTALHVGGGDDGKPGVFGLLLVPPMLTKDHKPRPRDVVFVLDRSGSMGGWKMVAARRAVGRMLETLLDADRFAAIAFDCELEYLAGDRLQPADGRSRWNAVQRLANVDARGGTEMAPPLTAALKLLAGDDGSRDRLLVFVTDGQIGNEDHLLRTLKQSTNGKPPRIFALGIDQAVNAGFLRRLAALGGGTAEMVESEDRLDAVMDRVHRDLGAPVLTDLRIEAVDGAIDTASIAPARLPDVFADRPVAIHGRWNGASAPPLVVSGRTADGQAWRQEIAARSADRTMLLSLWGRSRVRDLEDRYASRGADPQLAKEIVAASLEAHVLSRFTAYVAVDRTEVVNAGGKQHQVMQPVEIPAGWDGMDALAMAAAPTAGGSVLRCAATPLRKMRKSHSVPEGLAASEADDDASEFELSADSMLMKMVEIDPRKQVRTTVETLLRRLNPKSSGGVFERLFGRLSLVKLFRKLIDALRKSASSRPELLALATAGDALLSDPKSSNDDFYITQEVKEFLERVEALLDGRQVSPPAAASRGEFWK